MLTVLAKTALLDTVNPFFTPPLLLNKNKKGRREKKERLCISSFSKYLKKVVKHFQRLFFKISRIKRYNVSHSQGESPPENQQKKIVL